MDNLIDTDLIVTVSEERERAMRYMWDRMSDNTRGAGRLIDSSSVLAKYRAYEAAMTDRIAKQRAARLARDAAGGMPPVSDSELVTNARIAQRRV
jgi:hypothetical protein